MRPLCGRAGSADVWAPTSCNGPNRGHHYALAIWEQATSNQGAYADLYISGGHASDAGSGGHINQSLWENAYNGKYVGGNYWVEAGYTYGIYGENELTYYWAQNSPINGYHDHEVTSVTPTVGNWEPIQIQEVNGGNTWNVDFNWKIEKNEDGMQTIATSEPGYSEGMYTGMEATSGSSSLTSASSSGLEWWDPSSGWHSGWGSSAYVQCDPSSPNQGWVYWVSGQQDYQIQDGM